MEYIPPLNALPGDENDDNRSYWDADPAGNNLPLREGAYPPAKPFEHVQREIVGVITEAGLVPDEGDLTQLHAAILEIISANSVHSTLRNYISGFELSQAADAEHDITIGAGSATSSDNTISMESAVGITKKIDVDWVAGNDSGGFPSGLTLSNDTWYHVFVISNGTDTDFGFDTDLGALNLLSDATGYIKYRRIGSVLTDGSANITPFFMVNDEFYWTDPTVEYSSSTPSATAVIVTLKTPIGVKTKSVLACQQVGDNGGAYLSSLEAADLQPTTYGSAPFSTFFVNDSGLTNDNISTTGQVLTNKSSQIRLRNTDFGGVLTGDTHISTLGWKDFRGQNA